MQLQGTPLNVDKNCAVIIPSLDAAGCIDSAALESVSPSMPYTYVAIGAGAGIGGMSIFVAIVAVVIAIERRRRKARKLIIR